MADENSPAASTSRPARRTWKRRLMSWLGVGFCLFVLAWWTLLYFVQESLLFPRQFAPVPTQNLRFADTIVFEHAIDQGRVPAWLLPAPGVTAENPGPVVMFFHGNAEIIDYLEYEVGQYHRLGVSVFLPEFRGYGRADGAPSQEGIRSDVVYFYDQLIKHPMVDPSRVFFHGRSLGGGVAVDLASQRKPAAMILQSTFANVAQFAWGYGAPPFLVKNPYRSDEIVPTLDLPMLLFHGNKDTIVPVSNGHRLRDLAKNATYFEYACGHNDFPGSSANVVDFWDAVNAFLIKNALLEPVEAPTAGADAASAAEGLQDAALTP